MNASHDEHASATRESSEAPAHVQASGPAIDRFDSGAGGAALSLSDAIVQAKLTVGPAVDPYEREADAVADRVVRSLRGGGSAAGTRPGSATGEHAQRIQRASTTIGAKGGAVDADTDRAIQSSRGGGKAMPIEARRKMEGAFGADFGNVRIHEGAQATELSNRIQAKAFTVGSDVYFRDGMPDTGSSAGQHLLAHELTHTIQQGGAAQRTMSGIGKIQRAPASVQRRLAKTALPVQLYNLTIDQADPGTATASAAGQLIPVGSSLVLDTTKATARANTATDAVDAVQAVAQGGIDAAVTQRLDSAISSIRLIRQWNPTSKHAAGNQDTLAPIALEQAVRDPAEFDFGLYEQVTENDLSSSALAQDAAEETNEERTELVEAFNAAHDAVASARRERQVSINTLPALRRAQGLAEGQRDLGDRQQKLTTDNARVTHDDAGTVTNYLKVREPAGTYVKEADYKNALAVTGGGKSPSKHDGVKQVGSVLKLGSTSSIASSKKSFGSKDSLIGDSTTKSQLGMAGDGVNAGTSAISFGSNIGTAVKGFKAGKGNYLDATQASGAALKDGLSTSASLMKLTGKATKAGSRSNLMKDAAAVGVTADVVAGVLKLLTTIRSAVSAVRHFNEPGGLRKASGAEKAQFGIKKVKDLAEIAGSAASAAKTIITAIKGGAAGAAATAVPVISIVVEACELIFRGVAVVESGVQKHGARNDKKKVKNDAAAVDKSSQPCFGEMISAGELKDKHFRKPKAGEAWTLAKKYEEYKRLSEMGALTEQRHHEFVRWGDGQPALRDYLLAKSAQTVLSKRLNRAAVAITASAITIAGDITTLTGVAAPVGIGLKSGASGIKAITALFRTVKQYGRNVAAKKGRTEKAKWYQFNHDKSTDKKEAGYGNDVNRFFEVMATNNDAAKLWARRLGMSSGVYDELTDDQKGDPGAMRKAITKLLKKRE